MKRVEACDVLVFIGAGLLSAAAWTKSPMTGLAMTGALLVLFGGLGVMLRILK